MINIMVVEDEALVRLDVIGIFETAGFKVFAASSADEALTLLDATTSIDLLFSDIQMPGKLSGLDLAHLVERRWPKMAIMIASGEVKLAAGALPIRAEFFNKPYDANVIVKRANALTSEHAEHYVNQV